MHKLLLGATKLFAASFFLSSLMNLGLAQWFFHGFDATAIDALEKYNAIIARVTGWGFAVIGVPILVFLFFTLRSLLKGLGKTHRLQGRGADAPPLNAKKQSHPRGRLCHENLPAAQSTRLSTRCASSMSSSVTPPASWVVSFERHLRCGLMVMSGWCCASSAISARSFTKSIASMNSSNSMVRVIAFFS